MTEQEALQWLTANGWTFQGIDRGVYRVTSPDGEVFNVPPEDLIAGIQELMDTGQGDSAPPPTEPQWWPAGVPYPPLKWVQTGKTEAKWGENAKGQTVLLQEGGQPQYEQVFDYDAFARLQSEATASQTAQGGQPVPPPTDEQGNPQWTMVSGGQEFAWDTQTGSYRRASVADTGQETGLAKPEYVTDTEGKRWVRTSVGGQWQLVPEDEPNEQFLGTKSEGGWQIDEYGYTDPQTGKVIITARMPRAPIKDPVLSIKEMIAQALSKVSNWDDLDDPNLQYAQALYDFDTQIEQRQLNHTIAMDRLDKALQIAQSPSDYLTLVALYTGALQRDNPALVGERIAPLAQILQQQAQAFFLDIPGINTVPPYTPPAPPTEPPVKSLGEQLEESKQAALGEGVIPPEVVAGLKVGEEAQGAAGFVSSIRDRPRMATISEAEIVPQPEENLVRISEDTGEAIPYNVSPLSPELVSRINAPQIGQRMATLAQAQGIQNPTGTISPELVSRIQAGGGRVAPLGERMATIGEDTEEEGAGGPSVSTDELEAYIDIRKKKLADIEESKKKTIPTFQSGGVVPGYPGQRRLAQVEGGETVLTPKQLQALLGQSGLFGQTYQVPPQQLPEFLRRPRMVSLSQLTGGALRPRSAQTIRGQSPTQRALTVELAKSFGVPEQDFLEEEQFATSIRGPRRMARFGGTTIRTGA